MSAGRRARARAVAQEIHGRTSGSFCTLTRADCATCAVIAEAVAAFAAAEAQEVHVTDVPLAAALMTQLKEECERQHARAEAAERERDEARREAATWKMHAYDQRPLTGAPRDRELRGTGEGSRIGGDLRSAGWGVRIVATALSVAMVFFALCAHSAACAAYLVAREMAKLPPQGPAYRYARIVSAPLRWLLDK